MMHDLEIDKAGQASRNGHSARSEATRRAIGTIARQSFLDRGFEGACIEEIAASAKYSRRTIYNQFGGKQGLYEAVCRYLFRELQARIESRPIRRGGAGSRLDARISTIIAFLSDPDHDALMRLIIQDREPQPWLALAYRRLLADPLWHGLRTAIEAWLAEQGRPPADAAAVCDQCRALLEGAITLPRLRDGSSQATLTVRAVRALLSRLAGDERSVG